MICINIIFEEICYGENYRYNSSQIVNPIFETDLVPETERKEVARQVADSILAQWKDEVGSPEIVA